MNRGSKSGVTYKLFWLQEIGKKVSSMLYDNCESLSCMPPNCVPTWLIRPATVL